MPPELDPILVALAIIVPLEYTFVALSSLVAKVVVANFVRDLGEISRSRETKRECESVEHMIKARYKQSLLWPLEFFREVKHAFKKKEK
jgi:hypothetical protein